MNTRSTLFQIFNLFLILFFITSVRAADPAFQTANEDDTIRVACDNAADCDRKFIKKTIEAYDEILYNAQNIIVEKRPKDANASRQNNLFVNFRVIGKKAFAALRKSKNAAESVTIVIEKDEVLLANFQKKDRETKLFTADLCEKNYWGGFVANVYFNLTGKKPTIDTVNEIGRQAFLRTQAIVHTRSFFKKKH